MSDELVNFYQTTRNLVDLLEFDILLEYCYADVSSVEALLSLPDLDPDYIDYIESVLETYYGYKIHTSVNKLCLVLNEKYLEEHPYNLKVWIPILFCDYVVNPLRSRYYAFRNYFLLSLENWGLIPKRVQYTINRNVDFLNDMYFMVTVPQLIE